MNEEIKIEKGIPIPPKPRQTGISKILKSMEVGDSILIEDTKNACVNVISLAHRTLSIRICTRKAPDNKRRVWRIA